jgi:hypothetical protein
MTLVEGLTEVIDLGFFGGGGVEMRFIAGVSA